MYQRIFVEVKKYNEQRQLFEMFFLDNNPIVFYQENNLIITSFKVLNSYSEFFDKNKSYYIFYILVDFKNNTKLMKNLLSQFPYINNPYTLGRHSIFTTMNYSSNKYLTFCKIHALPNDIYHEDIFEHLMEEVELMRNYIQTKISELMLLMLKSPQNKFITI